MTDPRYGAADVSDSAPTPEPAPQSPSGRDSAENGTDASDPAADPQATTELPRTGWDPSSAAPSEPDSGAPARTPAATPSAEPDWSSDRTQNFPAYRPQSYPTYPPISSQTSELPAVSAGGPPPTTAAAYGGPPPTTPPAYGGPPPLTAAAYGGPAAASATAGVSDRPRRRTGAGLAGALGLIGLAAAAYGALALPIQKLGARRSPYFVNLRELSTDKLGPLAKNANGSSLVGARAATLWWRYGFMAALGVLALLLLVQISVPVLRRVAGVLLFLGALATLAGYAVALHQTNDYRAVVIGLQDNRRLPVHQLGLGVWVAVAGLAVTAVGGLIAAGQSTRR